MLRSMKLHLLILNIFIVLPMTGIGQTNRFDIGVEAGPNVLFFWRPQKSIIVEEPRAGFSTGLTFRYNFPKYFSIGTSPSFERRRTYTPPNGELPETGGFELIGRFDYLTVPILARFTVGKRVRFFVSAGPYMSYLIQYTSKANNGYTDLGTYNKTDLFKRLEFGVSAGLGFGVHIKDVVFISLEVRNNTGLTDISDSSTNISSSRRTNTLVPLIGVTYTFAGRPE